MSQGTSSVRVDNSVAQRLIEHIRNKTTDTAPSELRIPIDQFVNPARAEAEIALLKSLPVIVAHVSELKDTGSYVTREVLGVALLIVRQSDGTVAAFHNMCRHRGGRVEQAAAGSKRVFMCQYHGWAYNSEGGNLRHVPYEESFGTIDRSCNGLKRFTTHVRHGFVLVELSGAPGRSIEEYFGPEVDAELAPWGLERSQIFLDKSFTLDINWKLVMDGAVDSMHPQFLHVGGVGKLVATHTAVFQAYGRHGKLFQPRRKLEQLVREGAELEGSSKYISSLLLLYPNALIIGAPDHVEFWTVWPVPGNPNKSTVHIRFLVRPEILSPEMESRINASWDILSNAAQKEDWPMEEFIQKNAQANPDGTFVYGKNERAAQHLHWQLIQDLGNGTT
ncbi:aromatic ring-hydroxylating dioxygenase subunit alpha [Steroidobacter flavus]|uniref:Aromatic ring-hydroxylating dioxygenase subunit alpha n=1 Tax=Steroidobacter flavus TaxID=1842136 RepID=A0ABV8T325_9GAMM